MRSIVRLLALVLPLFAVQPLAAAPTCQDSNGVTIKCGTPNAMPVGWTWLDHHPGEPSAVPSNADPNAMLEVICIVAMLLAFLALLPDFDGSGDDDWDRQEGDKKRRR